MEKIRVLLVCGSGASTGFMAANIRRAALQRGIDMEINARSESEVDQLLPHIDCLMLAPHLKYLYGELLEKCKKKQVKIAVMDPSYYGVIDGNRAVDHIMYILKQET